jgi:hypothetical protein
MFLMPGELLGHQQDVVPGVALLVPSLFQVNADEHSYQRQNGKKDDKDYA